MSNFSHHIVVFGFIVIVAIQLFEAADAFQYAPRWQQQQKVFVFDATKKNSIITKTYQQYNRRSFIIQFAAASSSSSSSSSKTSPEDNDNDQDKITSNIARNREWLMKRFKFTKSKINYKFLTQDNSILEARADWLQERLELTDEEMIKIVQGQPMMLAQKYTSLRPKLDSLERIFGKKSLKKMVLKQPTVLSAREEDIQPKLDYLQNRLELDKKKLMKLIMKFPTILAMSLEENIKPSIGWLQQRLNLTDPEACKIVQKFPQILGSYSITDKMEPNLKWIQNRLSLTVPEVSKIIKRQPSVLGLNTTTSMEPKISWIQERLSITDDEVSIIFKRQPSIFTFDMEKNIKPTIHFYFDAIETEEDVVGFILKNPTFLTMSLGKRLIPRLAQVKEANIIVDRACLSRIARYTPEQWENWLPNNLH